ncbi:MAG: YlxR family protein [Anaerolineales bacterium]|nr:YlxR family protein [Anaerolineales bacterium]MCB0055717.1 YlxR family protein [Caldilineaceae bacterium]
MAKKKPQARRPKHVPQRTCVACRQKFDKRRLTRVVRTPEGGVVVDKSGKQNGRGAYLCDQPTCWDRVLAHRSILNQALQTTVSEADLAGIAAHKPASVEKEAE